MGHRIRPELAALPARVRRKVASTEFGVFIGRTVVGPLLRWRVYAAYIDVILLIAPPQTGKTAWLGGRIIDAVGAALVTSTKGDLWRYTHRLRALLGPVLVFNPEFVAGIVSTLRWSPVVAGLVVEAALGVGCVGPLAVLLALGADGGQAAGRAGIQSAGQRQDRRRRSAPGSGRPVSVSPRAGHRHQCADEPVISVDTKKREHLGQLPNPGREWRPRGRNAVKLEF